LWRIVSLGGSTCTRGLITLGAACWWFPVWPVVADRLAGRIDLHKRAYDSRVRWCCRCCLREGDGLTDGDGVSAIRLRLLVVSQFALGSGDGSHDGCGCRGSLLGLVARRWVVSSSVVRCFDAVVGRSLRLFDDSLSLSLSIYGLWLSIAVRSDAWLSIGLLLAMTRRLCRCWMAAADDWLSLGDRCDWLLLNGFRSSLSQRLAAASAACRCRNAR
jgi:hypothetical protein